MNTKNELKKLSELLVLNNLSDIHLHTPDIESDADSKNGSTTARTRIAGDLSEERPIEIDIPEILSAPNGINVTLRDKSFRLRTTRSPSKTRSGSDLFIRVLPSRPPSIETLGAERFFENIYDRNLLNSGLILAAGRAGSGKSTFIASILQHCITNFPIHVVSLEDPIEYVLASGKGYATQKEISFDSPSFKALLRTCMREDPDILFIGEVRDRESAETALLAAESGHLALGTIHAGSSAGIVDKLMGLLGNANPKYTAQQISQCLRTCLHIERFGMTFKYAYTKIDEALRNIIRDRALHQWEQYAAPQIIEKGGR